MKVRIIIPEPCNADWDRMQPDEKGRHCELCALTVVDFTGWELQDIADYLQTNAGNKVCGRFQAKQLEQSFDLKTLAPKVIRWNTYMFRKVAALIVICFAMGASGCFMGKASDEEPSALLGDTVMVEPVDTAEVQPIKDTAVTSQTGTPSVRKKIKRKVHTGQEVVVGPNDYQIMGGAMLDVRPEEMIAPPVKASPKFQPAVGPPEDEGKTDPAK